MVTNLSFCKMLRSDGAMVPGLKWSCVWFGLSFRGLLARVCVYGGLGGERAPTYSFGCFMALRDCFNDGVFRREGYLICSH